MDHIFDEDIFEVGAEVDAFCSRCKTDTPHTVLTKYEDEIRSVQCTTCSATHAYRPPRGDVEEEIPEPIAVRRRQSLQKLPWEQAIADLDTTDARAYSPKERYAEGQVLDHPRFGVGYVSELLSDTKLEAIFADGRRILVYNRGDLDIVIAPPRRGSPRAVAEALKKQKALLDQKSKGKAKTSNSDGGKAGAKVKPPPADKPAEKAAAKGKPVVTETGDGSGAKPAKARAAKPAAPEKAPPAAKAASAGRTPKAVPAKPAKQPPRADKPSKPAARPSQKSKKPAARPSPGKRGSRPGGAKPKSRAAATGDRPKRARRARQAARA